MSEIKIALSTEDDPPYEATAGGGIVIIALSKKQAATLREGKQNGAKIYFMEKI